VAKSLRWLLAGTTRLERAMLAGLAAAAPFNALGVWVGDRQLGLLAGVLVATAYGAVTAPRRTR
jgi:hypothetical protein